MNSEGRHLVSAAHECLQAGIAACGPNIPFSHVGADIVQRALRRKVGIIPELAGHGIGTKFQCSPDIYHSLNGYPGVMKPGHVFTIEPCITEGSPLVKEMDEGLGIVTTDDWRAAQFGHTIAITEKGVEILSL